MVEGNRLPKFLMNAGFYPITRNPPIVQVKPISEYLGGLLEFWELESPLDLMASNFESQEGGITGKETIREYFNNMVSAASPAQLWRC